MRLLAHTDSLSSLRPPSWLQPLMVGLSLVQIPGLPWEGEDVVQDLLNRLIVDVKLLNLDKDETSPPDIKQNKAFTLSR